MHGEKVVSKYIIDIDVSTTTTTTTTQPSTAMPVRSSENLIEGWKNTLPQFDHQWVSSALFKTSVKGKPAFDSSKVNKLWYHPPEPSLIPNQPPSVARYFTRRLLLWMPRRMWQVQLHCPQPECKKHLLTSAGIYPRVRQVLDIDRYYSLASEYLECSKFSRKVINWSQSIVKQLDIGHQLQFPVLITHQYACDIRVVRLLRTRGAGNSSNQLFRKLEEQHKEAWLGRCARYLSDCQAFTRAQSRGILTIRKPDRPPARTPVPKPKWLLTAYCKEVLSRIKEVNAQITSTFGKVLKIDSTRKVRYVLVKCDPPL